MAHGELILENQSYQTPWLQHEKSCSQQPKKYHSRSQKMKSQSMKSFSPARGRLSKPSQQWTVGTHPECPLPRQSPNDMYRLPTTTKPNNPPQNKHLPPTTAIPLKPPKRLGLALHPRLHIPDNQHTAQQNPLPKRQHLRRQHPVPTRHIDNKPLDPANRRNNRNPHPRRQRNHHRKSRLRESLPRRRKLHRRHRTRAQPLRLRVFRWREQFRHGGTCCVWGCGYGDWM